MSYIAFFVRWKRREIVNNDQTYGWKNSLKKPRLSCISVKHFSEQFFILPSWVRPQAAPYYYLQMKPKFSSLAFHAFCTHVLAGIFSNRHGSYTSSERCQRKPIFSFSWAFSPLRNWPSLLSPPSPFQPPPPHNYRPPHFIVIFMNLSAPSSILLLHHCLSSNWLILSLYFLPLVFERLVKSIS